MLSVYAYVFVFCVYACLVVWVYYTASVFALIVKYSRVNSYVMIALML